MANRRARRQKTRDDEPVLHPEEMAWCGDDLIYVVDHTNAGFPLGPTVTEMRRSIEHSARGAGWVRAKYILRELLELEVGAVRDVGWVKKIGDGRSRDIFAAEVELVDGRCDAYVVALPRRDADPSLDERTSRELRLNATLRTRSFPFRLPQMVGAFPDDERLALVRRYAAGVELDLRAGRRQRAVRPWQVVAEIAAAIHAVPGRDVASVLPGYETRAAHARAALAVFEGLAPIEMRDAHAWCLGHVPPNEPSVLLHGDLLGQNILLAKDGLHHVIGWEYATRGDPAYDLAIVTRGVRQPFQLNGGLDRLLDAYRAHGGMEVSADQVHLHELCLLAGWHHAALSAERPPAIGQLRSLLRRLR